MHSLPGEAMDLKWEDIQWSCTLNELVVKDIEMFFSASDSTDKAVAPATAKFTPWLKSAFSSLTGFRNGRPDSRAVKKNKYVHYIE